MQPLRKLPIAERLVWHTIAVVDLAFNADTERYEGAYDGFTRLGPHSVSFYAEDGEHNVSVHSPEPSREFPDSGDPPFEPGDADEYEDDDAAAEANLIVLEDKGQHHNFHDPGDADWVKLYAVEGRTYVIETADLGPNCDTTVRLYDQDLDLLMERHSWWAGDKAQLTWTCEASGIYSVEVTHLDPSVFGAGTEYVLRAYTPSAVDAAFISGIVRDSVTGAGIPGATIEGRPTGSALGADEAYCRREFPGLNDAALSQLYGLYLMGVPAGTYTLTAKAEGYVSARIQGVGADEGEEKTEVDFALEPRGQNHAPTGLDLTPDNVAENSSVGTVVGMLSTTDPDEGDTHTYALETSDVPFAIVNGNELRVGGPLDYETQNSYELAIRTTDAGRRSLARTLTVAVDDRNDAPVNTVPGPQQVDGDRTLVFNSATGNAISVSDVDAGAGDVVTELRVSYGGLTLNQPDGSLAVQGDGTSTVTVTGLLAKINAALDGLIYTPDPSHAGSIALTVTTNDQGHSGGGPPQSDTDTVAIAVVPIDVNIGVSDSDGDPTDFAVEFEELFVDGEQRSHTVTVENTGSRELTIVQVGLSDQTNYSIAWDGDRQEPTALSPGASRVAEVTFDPASEGSHSATLTIRASHAYAAQQTIVVSLNGAGYAGVDETLSWTNSQMQFQDGDGDLVTVYFDSRHGEAIVRRAAQSTDDPGDIKSIILSGTGATSSLTIAVAGAGSTGVPSVTGSGLYSFSGPGVDLVGNTIDLNGPLSHLRVRDISDGSDITLGGSGTDQLTLTARDVGDVDLTFPGVLSATVANWDDGVIDVNYISQLTQADSSGSFGADLDIQGQHADGWSLADADLAGDVSGETWDMPGDLGRRYRRRRKWQTGSLHCAGDFSAALTVGGQARLVDIDDQLRAAVDIGGSFVGGASDLALHRFSADGGSTAAGSLTVHGNAGTVQFGDATALTGTANGAIKVEGDADRVHLYGGTNGTVDVDGDLGRRYRVRRKWRTEGLHCGADLAAALTVDGQAWVIDIDGQLGGAVDIGASFAGAATDNVLNSFSADGGSTTNGALTVHGNAGAVQFGDSRTLTGPANGAIQIEGNANTMDLYGGTGSTGTIDVDGDLGRRYSRRKNGKKRWYTQGLRSGGDVLGAITVDGDAWLIDIDDRLGGALTVGGHAHTMLLDAGTSAGGDVKVTGELYYLAAGGAGAFAGDVTAGAIGTAYIRSEQGLTGAIHADQIDLNGDGDTDDKGETGNVNALSIDHGTGAGATINVEGNLGRRYSRRKNGRKKWYTQGFSTGSDGQLGAALTVGGKALSIVLGGGTSAAGDITVAGELASLSASGTSFAGDLSAGQISTATITSTNGLGGQLAVTQNDLDGDGAADTTGSVSKLHVEHGTAAGATIDVAGDLGRRYSRKKNGRKRWYTQGLRSGSDVLGAVTVDGDAWLVDIDGQLGAALTVGGHAHTMLLDAGTSAGGDVTVAGELHHLSAGGAGAFAGDVTAGAIGTAYIRSGQGLTGAIHADQSDLNGDGDTDDKGETGNVNELSIDHGTGAGATINVEGDLGLRYSRKKRGKKKWYTQGFSTGTNGQLGAALTVGGNALSIVLGNGTAAAGDITVTGELGGLSAGGTSFAGDLSAGQTGTVTIASTNGLEGRITVTQSDTDGDGAADTTGNLSKLHIDHGIAAGATIDVAGDLGRRYSRKKRGKRKWYTQGFSTGTNANVMDDITVRGTALLIDIGGDLVDASINPTLTAAGQLGSVSVGGQIRSTATEWIRSSTGTFQIKDSTSGGWQQIGASEWVFDGTVTARVG